ncbi:MAG: hypothetical protein ACOCVA_01715 [Prolixibacteraceae bacterium]
MKRILFIIALLTLISGNELIFAQMQSHGKSHKEKREKWRAEKIAFITDKVNLTPEEAQAFWPVYNELEQKRWEAQSTRRNLERKVREAEESLSEKEIIKLTREFAGSLENESELYVKYNEKFLEVLPPYKVLKLYKAENEFKMYMIRKFRDRHKNDN